MNGVWESTGLKDYNLPKVDLSNNADLLDIFEKYLPLQGSAISSFEVTKPDPNWLSNLNVHLIRDRLLSRKETNLRSYVLGWNPRDFAKAFLSLDFFKKISLLQKLDRIDLELAPYFETIQALHPLSHNQEVNREVDALPETSILKKFLKERTQDCLLDVRSVVRDSLEFLNDSFDVINERAFANAESPNFLTDWDQSISPFLLDRAYKRFTELLETAKVDLRVKSELLKIQKSTKSLETKISESLAVLNGVRNPSALIDELKAALTSWNTNNETEFNEGPLSRLNIGLSWSKDKSFAEQLEAKKGLEKLYYQIPEKTESCLKNQVEDLCKELDSKIDSSLSIYEQYVSFKTELRNLYLSFKTKDQVLSLLMQEAYLADNVRALKAGPQIQSKPEIFSTRASLLTTSRDIRSGVLFYEPQEFALLFYQMDIFKKLFFIQKVDTKDSALSPYFEAIQVLYAELMIPETRLSNRVYESFVNRLESAQIGPKVKMSLLEIKGSEKSSKSKIEESLKVIDEVKNPSKQLIELKNILSGSMEESYTGPLADLNIGFSWNKNRDVAKQLEAKEGFERLYAQIGNKTDKEKVEFYLKNQVEDLCKELGISVDNSLSIYGKYNSFKEDLKKLQLSIATKDPIVSLLMQEAYLTDNVRVLLEAKAGPRAQSKPPVFSLPDLLPKDDLVAGNRKERAQNLVKEFKALSEHSFLKKFLQERKVKGITDFETGENILSSLQLLAHMTKKEDILQYSFDSCEAVLIEKAYTKFIERLHGVDASQFPSAARLWAIREEEKTSINEKIQRSLNVLDQARGAPVELRLALTSFSVTAEEMKRAFSSGLLPQLNIEVPTDAVSPSNFLEMWKVRRDFELLYLETLASISHLNLSDLQRLYERGEFEGIKKIADVFSSSDIQACLDQKIRSICATFKTDLDQNLPSFAEYSLFRSQLKQETLSFLEKFEKLKNIEKKSLEQTKALCEEFYVEVTSEATLEDLKSRLNDLYLPFKAKKNSIEEAYLHGDVSVILECKDTLLPKPIEKLVDETPIGPPDPVSFATLEEFQEWKVGQEDQENPILKGVLEDMGVWDIERSPLSRTQTEKVSLVNEALGIFRESLKIQALKMKKSPPEEGLTLSALSAFADEIAYVRFLKQFSISKTEDPTCPVWAGLESVQRQDLSISAKRKDNIRVISTFNSALKSLSKRHIEELEGLRAGLKNGIKPTLSNKGDQLAVWGRLIDLENRDASLEEFEEAIQAEVQACLLGVVFEPGVQLLERLERLPLQKRNIDFAKMTEQAKNACFNFLINSSFKDSLEVDIGNEMKPKSLEKALQAFKKKAEQEIDRLKMPPIYKEIVSKAIQEGNKARLASLWCEIAYERCDQIVNVLPVEYADAALPLFLHGVNSSDSPIFQKHQVSIALAKKIKNIDLRNHLLFSLQQLPYTVDEPVDAKDIEAIASYFTSEQGKNGELAKYLRESGFSCLFWSPESYAWYAHLHEKLTEHLVDSNDETFRAHFETELFKLSPLEAAKTDFLIGAAYRKGGLKVKDACEARLFWCVADVLSWTIDEKVKEKGMSPLAAAQSLYAPFADMFQGLPFNIQMELLSFFWDNQVLIDFGFLRAILQLEEMEKISLAFLGRLLESETFSKGGARTFIRLYTLGYTQTTVEKCESEKEKILEAWKNLKLWLTSEEGEDSHLRFQLAERGLIDDIGEMIPRFGSTDQTWTEIQMYTLALAAFSYEVAPHMLLLDFPNTTIDYSKLSKYVPKIGAAHQNKINAAIEKAASTCDYFKEIGWKPKQTAELSYSSYYRHMRRVIQEVERKLKSIKAAKEGYNLTNETVDYPEIFNLNTTLKALRALMTEQNWDGVNNLLDKVVYTMYQTELHKLLKDSKSHNAKKQIEAVFEIQKSSSELELPYKIIQAIAEVSELQGLNPQEKAIWTSHLTKQDFKDTLNKASDQEWEWFIRSQLSDLPEYQKPEGLSIDESTDALRERFLTLFDAVSREIKRLNMTHYEDALEVAFYSKDMPLWNWLCNQVSYESYRNLLKVLPDQSTQAENDLIVALRVVDQMDSLSTESKIEGVLNRLSDENTFWSATLKAALKWRGLSKESLIS